MAHDVNNIKKPTKIILIETQVSQQFRIQRRLTKLQLTGVLPITDFEYLKLFR